jgi:hypothetical protein
MGIQNQIHHDALEPAQCIAADDSARPTTCQAHENRYYRALPEGLTPATVLEEMALVILREEKLNFEDRDILEKVVRVARAIKKIHTPEVEP